MVDPSGATEGIALGLRIIRDLHVYYMQFMSFHSDIEHAVTRMDRLTRILKVLEVPIQKLEHDNDIIYDEVLSNVDACSKFIKCLDSHRKKCEEVENSRSTLMGKIYMVQKRLAYPFRKDTLDDMLNMLDQLLLNLQTILQVLQLDGTARLIDITLDRAQSEQRGIATLRTNQSIQSDYLRSIENQTEQNILHTLSLEHKMETRLLSLEHQMLSLTTTVGEIGTRVVTKVPPSSIKESCDSYRSLVPSAQDLISRQRTIMASHRANGMLIGSTCTCKGVRTRIRQYDRSRLITPFSYDDSSHEPTCPYYSASQRTRTLGVNLVACRRRLGYILEASLSWSSCSLSPNLRYWNVVDMDTAPAFRLIHALTGSFEETNTFDEEEYDNLLDLTLNALVQVFSDHRASINDVERSSGWTIAHSLFHPTESYRKNLSLSFYQKTMNKIMSALQHLGADMNVADDRQCYPLDSLIVSLSDSNLPESSLFELGIPGLESLECYFTEAGGRAYYRTPLKRREIYKALHMKDWMQNVLSNDDILLSILERSEKGLIASLKEQGRDDSRSRRVNYCEASGDWLAGLKILAQHGHDPKAGDPLGSATLSCAISYSNLEVIEYLLQWGVELEYHHMNLAADDNKRQVFEMLVKKISSAISGESRISGSVIESPYHIPTLDSSTAEALYTAGLKEIDFNRGTRSYKHHATFGTPLMYHSAGLYHMKSLEVIEWLLTHGANRYINYPELKVAPLFLLAERIFLVEDDPSNRFEELIREIYSDAYTDNCSCACSITGCDTFTAVLNAGTNMHRFMVRERYSDPNAYKLFVVDRLSHIVAGSTDHMDRLVAAVLRVFTFDDLRLTHTCHIVHEQHLDWRFCADPSFMNKDYKKQLNEMRDLEHDDIVLLEEIIQEFEQAWNEYDGTLSGFMTNIWRPRMDDIQLERNKPKPGEIERMKEMGVELREYTEEVEPRCDTKHWWFWHTMEEMMGKEWLFDQGLRKNDDSSYSILSEVP